jgi:osmotically-inducible protein OsmY
LEVNKMPQTLKQAVEEALEAYSPLRTSRSEITVTVDEDQVTLSGYVPSSSIKGMAAILAGTVDGVQEVINELLAASELENLVAKALAADSRTRPWPIRVRAELGHVQLQGHVPDDETVQVALDVARQVEGPKEIRNALRVTQPMALTV